MSVKGMVPLKGLSLLQREQEVTKNCFSEIDRKAHGDVLM